jgi:methionyl-tRNA formyltransferase
LRTVFIGTSEFAAAVLTRLAGSAHRPALVATRPDSRRGRGQRTAPPPVADAARSLGIEVAQPGSVNDAEARAAIANAAPDAVCVCAYGGLIKEPLLSEHLMLNVHPSLLPRWRGAAPIERAIMTGDATTGVTIMRLTAGLDSGPICAQAEDQIAASDDYGILSGRLRSIGAELLVQTLDRLPACHEQDESRATYAEKISSDERRLDPLRPAQELERVVRALTPHIGAWVELEDGTRLGVTRARALPAEVGAPGRLVVGSGDGPTLACAEGALQLLRVKPPGRREMSGEEWVRGRRL